MKRKNYIIRPAVIEDAQAIAELNMSTRRQAYASFMPKEFIAVNQVTPQQIENWKKRILIKDFLHVAQDTDGNLAAMAWGGLNRNQQIPLRYELKALYVSPQHQRQNLGTKMIEIFARYCNGEPFYLYMLNNNPAEAFYLRLGGIRHPEYDTLKNWQNFTLEEKAFVFHPDIKKTAAN